jgi:hypothetical protein
MTRTRSVIRPVSVCAALAVTLAAGADTTLMSAPAAQRKTAATDDAEDLGVAEYQEVTADSIPTPRRARPIRPAFPAMSAG